MPKRIFCLITVLFIFLFTNAQENLKLWYLQPATTWTEALPLGNGRVGAMVFGGVEKELIQLNESSLWSGGPAKTNVNPGSPAYLPQVREAVDKGDYQLASDLCKKMQGLFSQSYLPMGDLLINQDFNGEKPSSYYRDLAIGDATATTRFTVKGTEYTREVFISAPGQVVVIRLTASKANQLNLTVGLQSLLHHRNMVIATNEIMLKGKAPAKMDPEYYHVHEPPVIYDDTAGCYGMRFQFRVRAVSKDGNIQTDTSGIHVQNATEVLLVMSAATSFNGYDKCPDKEGKDENILAASYLKKVAGRSYSELLNDHLADFHKYFNRVTFNLIDSSNSNALLPSNERLIKHSNGGRDAGLETLYFQFGRYLLISCSRPGGLPSNLQGIWNKELRAPWSSNYTININTQMNYWPAEAANLSEMHEPLFSFLKNVSVTGATTAREFYNLKGWVAHHNSDLWAMSNPVGDLGNGDPTWANWPMGGNWLCRHLWEHYQYTQDTAFLKNTAYPLMKGAVVFTLGWLTADNDGYLVTSPSGSPENTFIDENGREGSIAKGSTMDMSIIRDLFSNFIEASKILNTGQLFMDTVIEKQKKLYPFHIGKKGNIMEWYRDWTDAEVHHRHVSQLYGLYPGDQISPIATPALATAARKTLEIRGDEGTGWSKAWKINFWARLLDGNHAYLLFRDLLHFTGQANTNYAEGGGTYANFFDAHPPFQIDGNFGGTAGIIEMLLQSQERVIHLLPALPDAWKEGAITGLKARGDFEVSMQWSNKKLTKASIISFAGGRCTVRSSVPVKIKGSKSTRVSASGYYLTQFQTVKGRTYEVIVIN
jgi:alpha-L-fucosidase 2